MRKILFILILFIAIQVQSQQFTNKFMDDTLMLFEHWGVLMIIDTVNGDTSYYTADGPIGSYGDLDSASIDTFKDDVVMDSSLTVSGGYIANAIAQAYKAEYNISSQLGSWVHGIKVEMTRTADIQPASSGWFGGQFVLNSGTSAWDDINKPSYAIQGVIKGDQWDGIQDVNAGRFELQSSGTVDDIVYITANSGTTVNSSMLYMPTHVNVPNMIQFNAQSSATVTNGIDFVSGGGGSFNYGIDFSGATINTADIKLSNTGKISGEAEFLDDVTFDSTVTIPAQSYSYYSQWDAASYPVRVTYGNETTTLTMQNYTFPSSHYLQYPDKDSIIIDSSTVRFTMDWDGSPDGTDTVIVLNRFLGYTNNVSNGYAQQTVAVNDTFIGTDGSIDTTYTIVHNLRFDKTTFVHYPKFTIYISLHSAPSVDLYHWAPKFYVMEK